MKKGLLLLGLALTLGASQSVAYAAVHEITDEVVVEEEKTEPEEEPEDEKELNTVKVTDLTIVDDDQVSNEDKVSKEDQGTDDVTVVREIKNEVKTDPEKIFTAVEENPKFPGGEKAMYEYISTNICYPETAAQNNIQGRVTVQFVVEKDGSIGEVKVFRGKDPDLDKEAVRLVKSMPKFIPGKMNGQAVRVWYTLPVNFRLQS